MQLQRKGEGRKTSSGEKNHDTESDNNSASVFGEPPLCQQHAQCFACLITRVPRGAGGIYLPVHDVVPDKLSVAAVTNSSKGVPTVALPLLPGAHGAVDTSFLPCSQVTVKCTNAETS